MTLLYFEKVFGSLFQFSVLLSLNIVSRLCESLGEVQRPWSAVYVGFVCAAFSLVCLLIPDCVLGGECAQLLAD